MNIKKGDLIRATYKNDQRITATDEVRYVSPDTISGIQFYFHLENWNIEVIESANPEPVVGMILKHEGSGNKYLYAPRFEGDKEPWISDNFGIRFSHEGDIWPRVNRGDGLELLIIEYPEQE